MPRLVASIAAGLLVLAGGRAQAAENVVENVKKACEKELSTFCQGVREGEGRLLACLYAREDQVSLKCDQALYEAAVQLQQAIEALRFVAAECREDALKTCGDVVVGEGRVRACLQKSEKTLSERCRSALKQTGLLK
ncbi:MAG TPA: cysteine rich repeat-containing protein [Anaeromyxobacteraceae bacterium]|nr:cysteine rich repeat-containing protein [Anaeromyxobacteraceae bacterium]